MASRRIYHCSCGETFDSVALEVYGDEKYASELLGANVKYCEKMVFTGGEELVIPKASSDADTGRQKGCAPWKE